MKPNPLYPTTTAENACKHILKLVPATEQLQAQGLLHIYRNSIIQECHNDQSKRDSKTPNTSV